MKGVFTLKNLWRLFLLWHYSRDIGYTRKAAAQLCWQMRK